VARIRNCSLSVYEVFQESGVVFMGGGHGVDLNFEYSLRTRDRNHVPDLGFKPIAKILLRRYLDTFKKTGDDYFKLMANSLAKRMDKLLGTDSHKKVSKHDHILTKRKLANKKPGGGERVLPDGILQNISAYLYDSALW